MVVVPVTIALILLLLYLSTRSAIKTMIVILAVPFSAVGAIWLVYLLGYNMNVAVWVGLIALLGVDAETGVFMLLYLDLAFEKARRTHGQLSQAELVEAIVEGAAKRLRPKFMTFATMSIGLAPILWSTGTGSAILKRIAAPMVGGIVTSFVLELLVYPAIYAIWRTPSEQRLPCAIANWSQTTLERYVALNGHRPVQDCWQWTDGASTILAVGDQSAAEPTPAQSCLQLLWVALLAVSTVATGCHGPRKSTLTLSVAASLQDAIVEIEQDYQRDHGAVEFRNNFGSSGTLAREIEQGAPVDAFLSAGAKPMDDLQAKGLLVGGSRMNLLRNSLVLIVPQDSKLTGFEGLADERVRLLAMGDPASVPAGQYGRETLTSLKLYDKLRCKDRSRQRCAPGAHLCRNRECRCGPGVCDRCADLHQGSRGCGCARRLARAHRLSDGNRGRQPQSGGRARTSSPISPVPRPGQSSRSMDLQWPERDPASRSIAARHFHCHYMRCHNGHVFSWNAGRTTDVWRARRAGAHGSTAFSPCPWCFLPRSSAFFCC